MIDNIVINIRWRSTSFRNPDGLLPWSTQPRRKLTLFKTYHLSPAKEVNSQRSTAEDWL
jgi:hypothetical protein